MISEGMHPPNLVTAFNAVVALAPRPIRQLLHDVKDEDNNRDEQEKNPL
jgi:hypothetical protein